MKKFLTLLMLAGLFTYTQAQVIFSENFDDGTLGMMTAVDVDGLTNAPNVAGFTGPTFKPIQRSATNWEVVSTSWFSPPGICDDWLISPAIEITEENTFVVWEAYAPDASYRDGYELRISTTDNEVASFTDVIYSNPGEQTTKTLRAQRLDDYIGQTIHFAFRNNSNDKFLLYMDNIRVEVFKKTNVVTQRVSFEKYNQIGGMIPIRTMIQNYGGDPITSLMYTWEQGGNSYTDTLTGLNIQTLGTQQLTHSVPFDLSEAGEYPINVSISMPNDVEDEEPSDNTGARNLYGMDTQLPKKVVVEEATGTWCGWCPRGTVNMDIIAADHSDVAIPIAVHNGDPMTIAEYDGPFSSTVGGYPSGHLDRKILDIDPGTFVNQLPNIQNRMVPARIKTESIYEPSSRNVLIRATASLSIATTNNNLRFSCVITEDDVTGTTNGYNQVNYYSGGGQGPMGGFENLPDPVPSAQMVYDFVPRALFGGFDGMENSIPDAVEADEEFSVEWNYTVPANYDVEHMHAITFILDDETGEILNGDIVPLDEQLSAVPLIPMGQASLYPNPTSDFMNLSVDFLTTTPVSMKIYNTYGGLIADLGKLNLSNGTAFERINVADFAPGMYILELRQGKAVTAIPFNKL